MSDESSEDDIDRQLRELTEEVTSAARFKELSAADRAKRARKEAKRGQRRRHRNTRLKVGSIAVVILAAAGGFAWFHSSHSSGLSAPRALGSYTGSPPPANPFTGTPAANWADGESGITTPAAKTVGRFTAAQVANAYQATKRLLVAANLNNQTLLGGAPTAFADLLTSEQRATFMSNLNKKGVNSGDYPLSTRKWVASFFPGSAELIGKVIKVNGVMSAQTAHEAGTTVLAIQVNYLFAYAIEPPNDPDDWMRVDDHQYGTIDFAQWNDPGGPLEAWDQTIIGNAGEQCGTTDGYIHPDYPIGRTAPAHQSGPAINPYSNATSVAGGGAVCGRTSGT